MTHLSLLTADKVVLQGRESLGAAALRCRSPWKLSWTWQAFSQSIRETERVFLAVSASAQSVDDDNHVNRDLAFGRRCQFTYALQPCAIIIFKAADFCTYLSICPEKNVACPICWKFCERDQCNVFTCLPAQESGLLKLLRLFHFLQKLQLSVSAPPPHVWLA